MTKQAKKSVYTEFVDCLSAEYNCWQAVSNNLLKSKQSLISFDVKQFKEFSEIHNTLVDNANEQTFMRSIKMKSMFGFNGISECKNTVSDICKAVSKCIDKGENTVICEFLLCDLQNTLKRVAKLQAEVKELISLGLELVNGGSSNV